MKVILAGFNIDKSQIDKLAEKEKVTPETLSAAYARISRDPRDVPELRSEAIEKVKKARRSNRAIVFGMSHHSVAEHAYFNFDVLEISRLALEELEARRIGVAYTEKSQRYIKLEGDFVLPAEFSEKDAEKFSKLVHIQNDFYQKTFPKLLEYQSAIHPELKGKAAEADRRGISTKMNRARNTLEGWAKEDARYGLSLATQAQLGLSFNARTLEYAIRKMRYSELAEVRDLSQKLYASAKKVAPSLIILSDPQEFQKAFQRKLEEDHLKFTKSHLRKFVGKLKKEISGDNSIRLPEISYSKNVKFISENDIDKNLMAAIIHHHSQLSIEKAYQLAENILQNRKAREEFFPTVWKFISLFDAMPREFEFTDKLKFEVIVSASNFAQLKRHRLMTILAQDYDPELGITIPNSLKMIKAEVEFQKLCQQSETLYFEFLPKYGKAAEYCLTNAHRRRVLISVNPRELYHFSRLREDEHAQWDIKETAGNMLDLARRTAPLSFQFAGGKNQFL